jgi:DNA (cytosine-5)-methyltransferase 1
LLGRFVQAGDYADKQLGGVLAKFKFIDLFAGIGGFHVAFHNLGGECVFASEWDDAARKTYEHNFSKVSPKLFKTGNFAGDITQVVKADIPDFDILTGGFPCQPFSQAGHKRGFEDTRGTLFFDIAEIIAAKKPDAYFLENVRHLHSHDNGRTFAEIKRVLTEELGYSLFEFVVKASDHGLPQLRPRLFMIGFKDKNIQFVPPPKRELAFTMSDVFGAPVSRQIGFTLRVGGKHSGINDRRNWDGYLVDGQVRRITSKEGRKMQGFPSGFEFPVRETEAMKQLGNSVAVWAVQDYAAQIIKALKISKR